MGFSNGWAEFAFMNPPPLLPSSLIHSWEAMGPIAMCWTVPSSVVTAWVGSQVWGAPCHTSTSAPMIEIGSSRYRIARVRSTQ